MKIAHNGILVIVALAFLLTFVGFLFYWEKRMGGDRRKAEVYSLQFSLQSVYDTVTSKGRAPPPPSVDAGDMSAVLQGARDQRLEYLPSFVRPDEVFLSARRVAIPSRDLLLAVRIRANAIYAIDGSRNVRLIGTNEFQTWARVCLSAVDDSGGLLGSTNYTPNGHR